MSDYKNIHETIKRRDYDYKSGWDQEAFGLGVFVGILIIAGVMLIGWATA
jgi:hypothetical protein